MISSSSPPMVEYIHLAKYYSSLKYNVVILAGGMGTRMGEASQYIPKALTQFGGLRAIDHILAKYDYIANKFIIGVSAHHDLLSAYIRGRYAHLDINVSFEKQLLNTSRSVSRCLDYVDSSLPTIIQFCDLVLDEPSDLEPDTLFVASQSSSGVVGTFRHGIKDNKIIKYRKPIIPQGLCNGLCGMFVFANTPLLKAIAYGSWDQHSDITDDIVTPYHLKRDMTIAEVKRIYEFGSEDDLARVRLENRFVND